MLLFVALWTSLAFGDSLVLEPGWVAEHWTTREGLPSDVIHDMAVDPAGGLLLATADGLVHFDGLTFTRVHSGEPDGSVDGRIYGLEPDGSGGVWVVTESGAVQHRTAEGVRDHGRLAATTRPIRIGVGTTPPLVFTDAGVYELRDPPVLRTDLPPDAEDLLVDTLGWLLSMGEQFYTLEPTSGTYHPVDRGVGLARYDAAHLLRRQTSRYTFGQEGFARGGTVLLRPRWMASRALELGEATWVSTGGAGLYLIHPTPLRVHKPPTGVEGAARVLHDRLTDTVWASHPSDGHWWSPGDTNPRFEHVWIDGEVFPALELAEMTPISTQTRRWWWTLSGVRPQQSPDDADMLVLGPPETAPDPNPVPAVGGAPWTRADGSLETPAGDRLAGDVWQPRLRARAYGATVGYVRSAAVLPDGTALIGGLGGLARLPDDGADAATVPGLEDAHVRHLRLDGGWLWVATETRGLCVTDVATLDMPAWRCLGATSGLGRSLAHASLADRSGRTWVSTNHGLLVTNTSALRAFAAGERSEVPFLTLDETWGLDSAELNGFAGDAALAGGDGRLWFPGTVGLVEVHPDDLKLPATLTARASPPLPASLPADEPSIQTRVLVEPVAWAAAVQLRFRVGDQPWVGTGPDLRVAALPAGTSMVEVQARLIDDWQTVLRQEVVRAPHFTERAFFPLLVGIGALTLVAVAVARRNRALAAQRTALSVEVERQTASLSAQNRLLGTQAKDLQAKNQTISEQAIRLQQLDDLKRKLIADLAHELRTPLTLVIGALELRSPDVAAASRNAARLRTLLDELFDLSHLEAGTLRLRARRLDLGMLSTMLVERFQSGFEASGRSLLLDLPGPPVEVWADGHLLEKVIGNLLANALRHGAGQAILALRVDEGWVHIVVADEGPGVPEADRERVFERFVQLSTDDAREGTGIGLALARELVELHGGDIHVEVGARFCLRLPLGHAHLTVDDVDLEEAPRERHARPDPDADELRPQVVLAEDNDELRGFMAGLLRERWTVAEARDGREGLEMVRRLRPALVVSDVRMPRLDGLGLARAIRSDPAVSSVAILFVSARTQEDERVAGLELGDDYLTKPFGSAELLARASRLMRIGAAEPVTATRPAHETAFLDALGQAVAVGLSNPDFTVVALARKLAMSERTLQDRMKALDLPPPRSWLLEARLREARALLRIGQFRTVSEVAAAVGLSRAYFTRAYTAWAGHSPTHDAAGAPAEA